ncbi:MAG: GNAT family N-acetyltransferase [Anaerolineae bacterium]|nr:GNAT family N-acetyltransferase [Anaerolineae bacterium]
MNLNQLAALETSLRAVGRMEREAVEIPHFELFFSSHTLDHLTFAVPVSPDPDGWRPHILTLIEQFQQRGKRPRLEFIADLHPHLAPALEQAGLVCETRAPVMILDAAAFPPPPSPSPNYRPLDPDDEPLLRTYLVHQSIAFGGTGEDEEALGWLPNLQNGLRSGAVMAAAWQHEGRLLSGAVVQIGGGIGELAGVWTDANWRGRGLAYAVCQQLLGQYAAAGYSLCWLSAAEGAQRLYEKLGFLYAGTQLNYGRPVGL